MGISEAAISAHRRQLIDEGQLPVDAANPDRAVRVRTARLMLPLIVADGMRQSAPARAGPAPLDIVDLLTGGDPDCYGIVVGDELMDEAGIHAGDIAVVRPQSSAAFGNVVLAQVSDARTGATTTVIRSLRRNSKGRPTLRSARPYARGVTLAEAAIVGVVVSVMRRITE